jgi:hypothetical protein
MASSDRLREYRRKRNPDRAPEPTGGRAGDGRRFVVQQHDASSMHWDFRLEADGALKYDNRADASRIVARQGEREDVLAVPVTALVALVEMLRSDGSSGRLLDVQWGTPHLTSLGVVEISRSEYLSRLRTALHLDLPPEFTLGVPAR